MGCLTSLVHTSCCQRTQEDGEQVTTALSFFTPINCEREWVFLSTYVQQRLLYVH